MNKNIIFAIIACIALSSCTPFTRTQPLQDEVTIGVLVPLTGSYATHGTRIKNGFELAHDDFRANNPNTTVTILYEDVCQPKDALTSLNKLLDVDKIDILGASFCLIGFVPAIPILEQHKTIAFK